MFLKAIHQARLLSFFLLGEFCTCTKIPSISSGGSIVIGNIFFIFWYENQGWSSGGKISKSARSELEYIGLQSHRYKPRLAFISSRSDNNWHSYLCRGDSNT